MRYLIDPEYRVRSVPPERPLAARYAKNLRLELCERNRVWAVDHRHTWEETAGRLPGLLYREDGIGRHGNFHHESYRSILANPLWNRRLQKAHSTARHSLLSHDRHRKELDSCHSSDALLMNVFCNPNTLAGGNVQRFLKVARDAQPEFGYRPKTLLKSGRRDSTEIDMKIDDLLLEAKLTEYDFQEAPARLIERYEFVHDIFDLEALERYRDKVASYQLIRGVMAVGQSATFRFGVVCDARRPDLIERWHRLTSSVKPYDLRCRLVLFTWQEIAAFTSETLRVFLLGKYGIIPSDSLAHYGAEW